MEFKDKQKMREYRTDVSRYLVFVYGWMFLGLALTGVASALTVLTNLKNIVFGSFIIFIILIILEIAIVFYLSIRILKMSYKSASVWFILYSILNGLTLSAIFLYYTGVSIFLAFFITAGLFGVMAFYGLTTHKDLSSWGSLLLMGLVGIIIAYIVNFFLHSSLLFYIISYVGVAVFLGLTAYDNQKIKQIYYEFNNTDKEKNIAIIGALALYLDFINLFLFILRIFGRRRQR